MKKYFIFAISFILLFTLFQVLSGLFLTLAYVPDIEDAWNMSANLPQETIIKGGHSPFLVTLLVAFISATIAYYIPKRFTNNNKQHK